MSGYTIGEIVIWLVVAAALGFGLGWIARELLLRARSRANDVSDVRPPVPVAEPEAPVDELLVKKAPATPAKKAPVKKAPAKKAPAKKATAKKTTAKKTAAKKTTAKKEPAKKAPAKKATPPQASDDT